MKIKKLANKQIVYILIGIVIVLLLLIGYLFLVKPYMESAYNQGVQDALVAIYQQAQQKGEIVFSGGNETLRLVKG